MTATESTWSRFRDRTATESDVQAIWNDYQADHAASPSLRRCPDFEGFVQPLLWQLGLMDDINGREATVADALAVFATLAEEEGIAAA